MEIAWSEARKRFPLSRRRVFKETLAQTVGALSFLVIVWVILAVLASLSIEFAELFKLISLAFAWVVLMVLLVVFLYQRWYFAKYFYEFTPSGVQIKRGSDKHPQEIAVPYSQIQDVRIDRDWFDKLFGLYDVHIYSTIPLSNAAAHIDGLEKNAASELRATILKVAKH